MARMRTAALFLGTVAVVMAAAAPAGAMPAGDVGSPGEFVVASIPVGIAPRLPAADPARSRLYVANGDSRSVSVIDTRSNRVIAEIDVGPDAGQAVFDPVTRNLYVPLEETERVRVVDTDSLRVVATIEVGTLPESLAVDPAGHRLYVPNVLDGTVSVVDTRTNRVRRTIDLARLPGRPDLPRKAFIRSNVVLDVSGRALYLAGEGLLWIVDTRRDRVVDVVDIGPAPEYLALDGRHHRLYLSDLDNSNVLVVDTRTRTVVGEVPGVDSDQLVVDEARQRVYGAGTGRKVYVIDGRRLRLVTTLTVGKWPELGLDPRSDTLLAGGWDGTLTVIDTRTDRVVKVVQIGRHLQAPYVDARMGRAYVPQWGSISVTDRIVVLDTAERQ